MTDSTALIDPNNDHRARRASATRSKSLPVRAPLARSIALMLATRFKDGSLDCQWGPSRSSAMRGERTRCLAACPGADLHRDHGGERGGGGGGAGIRAWWGKGERLGEGARFFWQGLARSPPSRVTVIDSTGTGHLKSWHPSRSRRPGPWGGADPTRCASQSGELELWPLTERRGLTGKVPAWSRGLTCEGLISDVRDSKASPPSVTR